MIFAYSFYHLLFYPIFSFLSFRRSRDHPQAISSQTSTQYSLIDSSKNPLFTTAQTFLTIVLANRSKILVDSTPLYTNLELTSPKSECNSLRKSAQDLLVDSVNAFTISFAQSFLILNSASPSSMSHVSTPFNTNHQVIYSNDKNNTLHTSAPVSYTHLRAHETRHDLVCRLL